MYDDEYYDQEYTSRLRMKKNAPPGKHIPGKQEGKLLRKLMSETGLDEAGVRAIYKYRVMLSQAYKVSRGYTYRFTARQKPVENVKHGDIRDIVRKILAKRGLKNKQLHRECDLFTEWVISERDKRVKFYPDIARIWECQFLVTVEKARKETDDTFTILYQSEWKTVRVSELYDIYVSERGKRASTNTGIV
jgi:hypothetical protein